MTAAQSIQEFVLTQDRPDYYIGNQDYYNGTYLLFNQPLKRSHKSSESILFQSKVLSLSIELDRIKAIYYKYRSFFPVDFTTFISAYNQMHNLMLGLIPFYAITVTGVSEEDECIYNYYEFDGKKIFFNLFFDEDEPVATININYSGHFKSVEGPIEKAFGYLKKLLEDFNG